MCLQLLCAVCAGQPHPPHLHCSGGRAGGPCPSQDSWHLSVTEGKWRQLPFCSAGRAWSAMAPLTALDGGIVVLFGGIDAMNRQTLAVSPSG